MAFELPIELFSRPANAGLATAVAAGTNPQFCFAAIDSSGNVGINGVAGGRTFGVIQSIPQYAGDAVTLTLEGIAKVVCGSALADGTVVMSDANGHAVAYAPTDVALGTLSTALVSGTPVTALAVAAGLAAPVAAGDQIVVTSAGNTQTFTASAAAAKAATSIPVNSESPNFSYPNTSTVADATTTGGGTAAGTVVGSTANALEIASVQLGGA